MYALNDVWFFHGIHLLRIYIELRAKKQFHTRSTKKDFVIRTFVQEYFAVNQVHRDHVCRWFSRRRVRHHRVKGCDITIVHHRYAISKRVHRLAVARLHRIFCPDCIEALVQSALWVDPEAAHPDSIRTQVNLLVFVTSVAFSTVNLNNLFHGTQQGSAPSSAQGSRIDLTSSPSSSYLNKGSAIYLGCSQPRTAIDFENSATANISQSPTGSRASIRNVNSSLGQSMMQRSNSSQKSSPNVSPKHSTKSTNRIKPMNSSEQST